MASYDSAGYVDRTPAGPVNAQGFSAPGSAGADPAATSGPVIGSPVVSVPGASSQVPGNRPTVAVHTGDSAGMADDVAAHTGPFLPGPQDAYLATGAGAGSTTTKHPNAGR